MVVLVVVFAALFVVSRGLRHGRRSRPRAVTTHAGATDVQDAGRVATAAGDTSSEHFPRESEDPDRDREWTLRVDVTGPTGPVDEATVVLYDHVGRQLRSRTTPESGGVTLAVLGRVWVRVRKGHGWSVAERQVWPPREGNVVTAEFVLRGTLRVHGVVRDLDGERPAQSTISLANDALPESVTEIHTEADGAYRYL